MFSKKLKEQKQAANIQNRLKTCLDQLIMLLQEHVEKEF